MKPEMQLSRHFSGSVGFSQPRRVKCKSDLEN